MKKEEMEWYQENKTTPIYNGNYIYEYSRILLHFVSETYNSIYNDTDSIFLKHSDYNKLIKKKIILYYLN